MTDSEKNWSDYWIKEGTSGEVFVNKAGQKHSALTDYWRTQFNLLQPGARVIDLASGAGSIFADLDEDHGFTLAAADISAEALRILKERLPATETILCGADKMPLDSQSFDLVVSQFGVEYAGLDAFDEAARLVKEKGSLCLLCHYQNGFIDALNQEQLRGARLCSQLGFIDLAMSLSRAAFSDSQEQLKNAEKAFIPAERQLAQSVKENQLGVHNHLYFGFRQLFERRRNYDLSDITDWLEGMRGDVEKNILRLIEMCNAALSDDKASEVKLRLENSGLQNVTCEPFTLDDHDKPLAWSFRAGRA